MPLMPVALWGTQRLWTKGRPRNFGPQRHPRHHPGGRADDAPPGRVPGAHHPAAARAGPGVAGGRAARLHRAAAGPDDTWWLPAHLGGTAPTPEEVAARGACRGSGVTGGAGSDRLVHGDARARG